MKNENPKNVCHRTISYIACLAILLCSLTLGCKKEMEPETFVPVKVKILEPEEITLSTRFSGSVEPLQTTSLAFKLAGTVERLHRPANVNRDVQVGDTLSKGTVIAELEEGDLRRAKASAEARVALLEARVVTATDNLEIAKRNFQRFVSSGSSISKAARDDAEARRVTAAGELAAAEHSLADARVQLDQANDNYINRLLVVPFDQATVAEKQIEPGERVQSNVPVFKLIDISSVHVRFGVPDTMIGTPALPTSSGDTVFLGQNLQITSDAFSGRAFDSVVTKVAPQADERTRTFLTGLTLPNPQLADGQRLLRPGMIVTVLVGAQHDQHVMLLPMAAIHRGRSPEELMVFEALLQSNRKVAKARKVSVGDVFNNMVEILPVGSEVQRGSRIVVTTAERLTDSTFIRVVQDSGSSGAVLPEAR